MILRDEPQSGDTPGLFTVCVLSQVKIQEQNTKQKFYTLINYVTSELELNVKKCQDFYINLIESMAG